MTIKIWLKSTCQLSSSISKSETMNFTIRDTSPTKSELSSHMLESSLNLL